MHIGIAFKFCQTHVTLHHWISQTPWQYLGRIIHLICHRTCQITTWFKRAWVMVEICTTASEYWGAKDIVVPIVQKLGDMSPPTPWNSVPGSWYGPCVCDKINIIITQDWKPAFPTFIFLTTVVGRFMRQWWSISSPNVLCVRSCESIRI